MADPLIAIAHLNKIYGTGETAVHALDDVSFDVMPGELMAIMGPSGCGKSTLLNMIGALDRSTSGTVKVAGEDVSQLRNVDRFRAQTVGFVFQLHNLLPTLTALENVEVPMQGQGVGGGQRRARALHLLEMVGLADRADHLPNQLSGGQRQRIAVARSLANEPRLILADEPTGSLDSQSGEEVLALLGRLNAEQGTTVVIVTHDRGVAQVTQRIVRMRDGRVEADHRLANPLEEDLRMLARSRLGQAVLETDDAPLPYISDEEEAVLRRILVRVREADQGQATTGAPEAAVSDETQIADARRVA